MDSLVLYDRVTRGCGSYNPETYGSADTRNDDGEYSGEYLTLIAPRTPLYSRN